MDQTGSIALYLLPGMSAKIAAFDEFALMGTVKHRKFSGEFVDIETVNGFVMDDDTVGELEAVPGEPAIIYKHKKYSRNIITFYSRMYAMGRADIISVPIHDHASIVSGGPAFGTYFTDDETVEESEEA